MSQAAAGATDAHAYAASDHPRVGHVVPVRVLAGVLAALLLLTVLTVAATYVDLGQFNIWLALGIATVKAVLVVLYFMHLRYDPPFNGVILITTLAFVALFVGLALIDAFHYRGAVDVYRARNPEMVAPALRSSPQTPSPLAPPPPTAPGH